MRRGHRGGISLSMSAETTALQRHLTSQGFQRPGAVSFFGALVGIAVGDPVSRNRKLCRAFHDACLQLCMVRRPGFTGMDPGSRKFINGSLSNTLPSARDVDARNPHALAPI